MKLKYKLLISLITIIILPLVIGIGITYFSIKNSIDNIDEKTAYANLNNIDNYINSIITNHSKAYGTYTPWTDFYNAIQQKDINWIHDNISSTLKEDTDTEIAIVINSDGSILSAFNSPPDWKNINFRNFNLFKKLTASTPRASGLEMTSDGLYIASIAKVVKTEDANFSNFDGYILYARKINNSTIVNGKTKKGLIDIGKDIVGTDISLKLDNGTIISTSKNNTPINIKSSDFKNNEVKLNKELLGKSMKLQTEKVLTDAGNQPIGVLSVSTESTSGVTALNTLLYCSIILVFVLVIFVIILILVITNTGLKPFEIMIDEFNKIASGDFTENDERNHFEKYLNKKDEIGEFSRAFIMMKTNLKNMILSVNKSVSIVSDTSKILLEIANNTNQAANETTQTIDSMANEATKQSDYSISS